MIVGLTGGIGSGKTTVAKLFKAFGVHVFDSDQIVHDLLSPNKIPLKKIVEYFGSSVLKSDGTLDRSRLRALIFDSEEKRLWLEQLLHPLVKGIIQQECYREDKGTPYTVVEIPLLFEARFEDVVDRILVVDCPEADQINRVIKRDNVSAEHVQTIMDTQTTRTYRQSHSHDILENSNDLNSLKAKVEALHHHYIKLSK